MRTNQTIVTAAFVAAFCLGAIFVFAAPQLGLKATYQLLALLVGSFHAYALLGVIFLFGAFFV